MSNNINQTEKLFTLIIGPMFTSRFELMKLKFKKPDNIKFKQINDYTINCVPKIEDIYDNLPNTIATTNSINKKDVEKITQITKV